jgi:hypothetical protein
MYISLKKITQPAARAIRKFTKVELDKTCTAI